MGKNKDAIVILIIAFLILGFSWDSIKQSKKSSNSDSSSSKSSFFLRDRESENSPQVGPGVQVTERDISNQIKNTEKTVTQIQRNLEEEALKAKRSPYYGKFNISRPSYLNNPDPSKEYITISPSLGKKEKVDITGWMLKSERSGNWVKIGGASTLPKPFQKNYSDVSVQQGDIIYLVKGFSPIGISFRTNKCTGFFEENRSFYPGLQRACPLPKNEKLPKFSEVLDRDDECLDIIERIPACTTPEKIMNLSRLPDTVVDKCKNYLRTEINYDACVEDHIGDTNFPSREWYVYLNIFGPLWRSKRESIILYDNKGLIVDSVSY